MKVHDRLNVLSRIYDTHDAFTSDVEVACHRGCATCCTCNVSATTLEALMIHDHLVSGGRAAELDTLIKSPPSARYRPTMTLNQMVAMFARGQEPDDESNDPSAGTCPLLDDGVCSIYAVRPFGCRAMLSTVDCSRGGKAQMPPFMLSVGNVIMQYIEALDQPGGSGNLLDLLGYLAVEANRKAYVAGGGLDPASGLLINRSFPVLMVPPEHRRSIQPLIQSLNDLFA